MSYPTVTIRVSPKQLAAIQNAAARMERDGRDHGHFAKNEATAELVQVHHDIAEQLLTDAMHLRAVCRTQAVAPVRHSGS